MDAGMTMATGMMNDFTQTANKTLVSLEAVKQKYERRFIFLTDAQPNTGDISERGLFGMFKDNAQNFVFSTFLGVGLDFNSKVAEITAGISGANYYTVNSVEEITKRLDKEFNYMVTPLAFDVEVSLDASDSGFRISRVFGSPGYNDSADGGSVISIATLFPSAAEEESVKGGVVLLKLQPPSSLAQDSPAAQAFDLGISVKYLDRNGMSHREHQTVHLHVPAHVASSPDYYDSSGVRKAILLTRYVSMLRTWILNQAPQSSRPFDPRLSIGSVIPIPPPGLQLGPWERQSRPFTVTSSDKQVFDVFSNHMMQEIQALRDPSLEQEVSILRRLIESAS